MFGTLFKLFHRHTRTPPGIPVRQAPGRKSADERERRLDTLEGSLLGMGGTDGYFTTKNSKANIPVAMTAVFKE